MTQEEGNRREVEDYKRELVEIFFAQLHIIILVTSIIFIGALLIAFLWPPTFSATGSILVKGKKAEKSSIALVEEEIRSFRLTKEDLVSEVEILESSNVLDATAKYLKDNKLLPERENTNTDNSLVYNIKNSLKTEIVTASNVIKITIYNKDPNDAVTILKALMEQYILYRMQIFNPIQTEAFLSNQLGKFKDELAIKSEELVALSEKTQLSDPQKEIENNLTVKKDLEQQLHILKNDAIEKELYLKHLDETLNSRNIEFFSSIENPAINGLEGLGPKLLLLIAERGNILRTYNPLSEKVQAIERQINDTNAMLKNEVLAYKASITSQLNIINEKIRSIEGRIVKISSRNVEVRRQDIYINRIEREVEMLLSSYETFSRRREEAEIGSSKETANLSYVSILSKAFPSKRPVFPKKGAVIPLGIIVGFITGCSLGFLREYFDHTFKKPSDVYNYTGLPLIFSIPEMKGKTS